MDELLVAVDVPEVGDARGKNWAKVVIDVDDTRSSGWAFTGDFIATGGVQDVPPGSVILVYGERGSRGNPQQEARVYTVNADGTLTHRSTAKGRAWARTLRDPVADLVGEQPASPPKSWDPELQFYDDMALVEELRRRGHDFDIS